MNNYIKTNPKKILIIRLSSLGDIIHCLPVSFNLRKQYPEARLIWLVREKYKELLEIDANLDEIIAIKDTDSKRIFGRIKEIIKIINFIRKSKFDIILDLHCVLITNIIALFSGSTFKFGIDKNNDLGIKILKYCPLPKDRETRRINAYLSILSLVGITSPEIKYSFRIPAKDKTRAVNLCKKYNYSPKDTIIALHPGAAQEIKQWAIERFASVASSIVNKYNFKVIIIYGPKEENYQQNSIVNLFDPKVSFCTGNNIKELSALLEKCDLFIGNDSGPLHLAAALGVPTISIFGPSNHHVSSPWGDKHKVIRKNLNCSPCYGTFRVEFECKNKNRNCLKLLSTEEALEKIRPILTDLEDTKQEEITTTK